MADEYYVPDQAWRRVAELKNEIETDILGRIRSFRDALDDILDKASARRGECVGAEAQVRWLETERDYLRESFAEALEEAREGLTEAPTSLPVHRGDEETC